MAIKLHSGLGNNLFQYAAARVLAERKGYGFCYFPIRTPLVVWRTLKKRICERIGRAQPSIRKQIAQKDIAAYFTLGRESPLVRWMARAAWLLTPPDRKKIFSPVRRVVEGKYDYEIFDERIFDIADDTQLDGGFQSVSYFEDRRSDVVAWFRLRSRYARILARLESGFPVPPQRRCCIHVRRGDQLHHDKGLAWGELGWSLPLEYFKEAISRLPDDLFFVIATDSPAYAEEAFDFLPNKYVSAGNPEAVDMHLFCRCRYNIISNSTFSWWGAWLNSLEDKVVIAPKYNMGWTRRMWIPWAFDRHPEDWTYIDVLDLVGSREVNGGEGALVQAQRGRHPGGSVDVS